MKNENAIPVFTGTFYLVVYIFIINFFPESGVQMIMFAFSQFIVIWMAIYILKHGKPSGRKFDEYFYDDERWKRNSGD